jgi:hypothetical protein
MSHRPAANKRNAALHSKLPSQVSANAAAVTRLNAAISEIVELPPCMGASQPCAPIGALSMAKRDN